LSTTKSRGLLTLFEFGLELRIHCKIIISICKSSKRSEETKEDVLLSIRYGIPNTIIILTPAIKIIGFFSKLKGETIPHH
jgi:hypothetical protein